MSADTSLSNRRTIAYVGGFELPDKNTAGLRVLANAHILQELGYEIVFFGISQDLPAGSAINRCTFLHYPFECWNLPRPQSGREWFKRILGIDEISAVLESHYGDRLAGVICYDFPAIAQARLARVARRLGALAIAETTEWYGRSRLTGVHSLAKDFDTWARMRLVNGQMDGVIAASRFLKDYYAGSTEVIELPTVLPDFPQCRESRQATPDGQPKRLFFGATGFEPSIIRHLTDGPKDRLDKAIKILHGAWRAGAWFQLDIYGVHERDYRAIYPTHQGMLADLGSAVRFHGPQPRDYVREELSRADFSIFLRSPTISTIAGFPTKYSESIHVGTPVITNRIGSIVEYHEEDKTGHYLDFSDHGAAVENIVRILGQSSAKVQSMKDYCRESKRFAYQRYRDRFQAFLDAAARGRVAPLRAMP